MKNKSPVGLYLKIVLLIIYIIVSLGWILPFLISSKSDELPLIGVVYIVSMPVILYYSGKSIYKQLISNENEET
jgi:hypothetical protein